MRNIAFALMFLAAFSCARSHAQAALLMAQPYGFFGAINPTGHTAIYMERVCADTPVHLRRCLPGEFGAVISRYQGINGYDWIAMPLIPYLYSVENASDVPARVDRKQVERMRDRYREKHLGSLGPHLQKGNLIHGGWTELVGVAYERRVYAFRFDTTPEQDDSLIALMNAGPNHTRFELFYSNCADFARGVLNSYFPGSFRRSFFPDAGMTTPKQLTCKLGRYARKHPETHLTVFEIAQVPGYRRRSRSNKNIAESLTTTGYAVPLVMMNPYLAGGLFVDYMVRGRYHSRHWNPQLLGPDNLDTLTALPEAVQNPRSAGLQVPSVVPGVSPLTLEAIAETNSGLPEIMAKHE
jgi:hypothetical protein